MSKRAPPYTFRMPTKRDLVEVCQQYIDMVKDSEQDRAGNIDNVDALWDIRRMEVVLSIVKDAKVPK